MMIWWYGMKGWLNYFYKLLVLVSLKRVGWRTEPCSRSKMISAFYWWSHSVSYFRTVIDKRRLSVRGGLQSGEHLPAAAALGRSASATSGRLPASLFDLWHVNQRPLHDLCWRLSFLHSQENIRRQNPQSHLQSATTYVCTEHFQPAMRSLERIVALLPWCSSVRLFACLFDRLSGTGVYCDHTVHFRAEWSLWLDSPMLWALWHQNMSTYS